MKKISFYFLIFISCVLASCSKEDTKESESLDLSPQTTSVNSLDFDLESKIEVTRSTHYISSHLLKMGVSKINVTQRKDEVIYKPATIKDFYLNDNLLNFSDYELILKDNFAHLKSNPAFQISTVGNRFFISSINYTGFADDFSGENGIFAKDEVVLLTTLVNEIMSPKKIKILVPDNPGNDYEPSSSPGGTNCSFMGTITYFYGALTRSVAIARATYQRDMQQLVYDLSLQEGGGGGQCKPIGGIDSSCAFGSDYGCVASYSVCCD